MTWFITNAVAKSMADDFTASLDAGTAGVFRILDGSVPADADAAETGTLGGTLTCSATSSPAATDDTPGALLTFSAITDDSSADNSINPTTYFRLLTQTGGTVIAQGACSTSGAELNWNTTNITAGSTLSITSFLVTLPES
jgi:hypothetical protein